jgi:hypothetical protein
MSSADSARPPEKPRQKLTPLLIGISIPIQFFGGDVADIAPAAIGRRQISESGIDWVNEALNRCSRFWGVSYSPKFIYLRE